MLARSSSSTGGGGSAYPASRSRGLVGTNVRIRSTTSATLLRMYSDLSGVKSITYVMIYILMLDISFPVTQRRYINCELWTVNPFRLFVFVVFFFFSFFFLFFFFAPLEKKTWELAAAAPPGGAEESVHYKRTVFSETVNALTSLRSTQKQNRFCILKW